MYGKMLPPILWNPFIYLTSIHGALVRRIINLSCCYHHSAEQQPAHNPAVNVRTLSFQGHCPPSWPTPLALTCPFPVFPPELVSAALLILWVPLQGHVAHLKQALILACCALSVQIKSQRLRPTLQGSLDSSCQHAGCWKPAAVSGNQPISSDNYQVGSFLFNA